MDPQHFFSLKNQLRIVVSQGCVLLFVFTLLAEFVSEVCSFEKANNASGKFGGVAGVFVGAAI